MSDDLMCRDCRGKLDRQALSDASQEVDRLRAAGKTQKADKLAAIVKLLWPAGVPDAET